VNAQSRMVALDTFGADVHISCVHSENKKARRVTGLGSQARETMQLRRTTR